MNKNFIKNGELQTINGGYLVNKDHEPVFHAEFYKAQKHAHYVVSFAEMAKGKDFQGKEAESLAEFKRKVFDTLYGNKTTQYISVPKAPKQTINDQLKNEALAFVEFNEKSEKVNKINEFIDTNFGVINEFEEFGLYFEKSEIVKLDKIYTVKEIIKAVEKVIDLLN